MLISYKEMEQVHTESPILNVSVNYVLLNKRINSLSINII